MSDCKKTYIELCDKNGTYRIERDKSIVVIDDVMEEMVIPLLLAAGYSRQCIDRYFGVDDHDRQT